MSRLTLLLATTLPKVLVTFRSSTALTGCKGLHLYFLSVLVMLQAAAYRKKLFPGKSPFF